VADAADALIQRQVRSGLVVRMAVLYDLLTVPTPDAAVRAGGPVEGVWGNREVPPADHVAEVA
jgi:hypothetical protein